MRSGCQTTPANFPSIQDSTCPSSSVHNTVPVLCNLSIAMLWKLFTIFTSPKYITGCNCSMWRSTSTTVQPSRSVNKNAPWQMPISGLFLCIIADASFVSTVLLRVISSPPVITNASSVSARCWKSWSRLFGIKKSVWPFKYEYQPCSIASCALPRWYRIRWLSPIFKLPSVSVGNQLAAWLGGNCVPAWNFIQVSAHGINKFSSVSLSFECSSQLL